jgi:hypothetical protein
VAPIASTSMSTLARTMPEVKAPDAWTGTSTAAPVRSTSSSSAAAGSAARRMT